MKEGGSSRKRGRELGVLFLVKGFARSLTCNGAYVRVPTRNCFWWNSTPNKSNYTPTPSVSGESVCPTEPLKGMDYSGTGTRTPLGEICTRTKPEQYQNKTRTIPEQDQNNTTLKLNTVGPENVRGHKIFATFAVRARPAKILFAKITIITLR